MSRMMKIQVAMSAELLTKGLNLWLENNLPLDISIRQGKTPKGKRRVVFNIAGSSQEDILAKWEALETLIEKSHEESHQQ